MQRYLILCCLAALAMLQLASCKQFPEVENTPEAVAAAFKEALYTRNIDFAIELSTDDSYEDLISLKAFESDDVFTLGYGIKLVSQVDCTNIDEMTRECLLCCKDDGQPDLVPVTVVKVDEQWKVRFRLIGNFDELSPEEQEFLNSPDPDTTLLQ